ncbi:MAG: tetratricopeptide repeat protein [Anaerolineae bacterium]|nr:tetratricopeptide repeat protein [Anaerolineae bacterium]
MPEQVPFVGRKNELNQVEGLIEARGTRRVLCIQGDGGVGKTRLLQEVRQRYIDKAGLLMGDIIDFDDRALHVIENVERQVMQNLGLEAFEKHTNQRLDWYRMKQAGVSSEKLEQEAEEVRQTLIDDFNQLAKKRRIVLPMDTMEKLEGTNAWERLKNFIIKSQNTLFILSGRTTKNLYKELRLQLGGNVTLIELQPLEEKDSQQYLDEKQRQLHRDLDPNLTKRLLVLAQGRPILIDLAVEWLSRNLPLDWLIADELPQEGIPSKAEIENFQIQLVNHIGQIRSQVDQLILLMSRVYPLDSAMIAKALNVSSKTADTLRKQAQTYVFVKSTPDGHIYLHDEMRRMVREYVWPEIDPDGSRRHKDSSLAVAYFQSQVKTLTEKINLHRTKEEEARQAGDVQTEFDEFITREILEQELWALNEQLLFHTLFIDAKQGVESFVEIFDEATEAYQYSSREVLLKQMESYIELTKNETYLPELLPEQKYEVDIRLAKYYLDSGQYNDAEKLLQNLLEQTGLQPAQKIDAHIQLANVVIRLGDFQGGIEKFKQAVQLSQENKLKEWLVKAENGLGWAYRLTADLQRAGEHYHSALDLAEEIGLKHQQAMLYGNLGFLYTYYAHIPDNRDKALWFCDQSLSLWKELKDKRGQGRAYSTMGCIKLMDSRYEEAMECYQKSLDIFEPAYDREWLSLVYSWRGTTYMSMGNMELAEADILRSLDLNILKDRPINLSRLSQLYMLQGKLDEAQKAVEECRKLALKLPDVWYQLVSLRDLANVSFYKKEYAKLDEFQQALDEYLKKWGESQDLRAFGMFYLSLGNLALGQSDLNKAVQYYETGLGYLVRLGRYGNDTPQTYIERLEKVMVEHLTLSEGQIREIGSQLLSFWQAQGLNMTHPDIRIRLSRWAKWEEPKNASRR